MVVVVRLGFQFHFLRVHFVPTCWPSFRLLASICFLISFPRSVVLWSNQAMQCATLGSGAPKIGNARANIKVLTVIVGVVRPCYVQLRCAHDMFSCGRPCSVQLWAPMICSVVGANDMFSCGAPMPCSVVGANDMFSCGRQQINLPSLWVPADLLRHCLHHLLYLDDVQRLLDQLGRLCGCIALHVTCRWFLGI